MGLNFASSNSDEFTETTTSLSVSGPKGMKWTGEKDSL